MRCAVEGFLTTQDRRAWLVMSPEGRDTTMHETVARLRDAINRHDVARMAEVFSPDYRSEQPAHPNRGFGGRDQVVTNWTAMFAGMPDFSAEVVSEGTADRTVWSEWVWRGSRGDGSALHMRGVIVLGPDDTGRIEWARLYMEPVEEGGDDINQTMQQLTRLAE